MAEQILEFKKLAAKGVKISVHVLDTQAWQRMIKTDRSIPRSFFQLRRLGQMIFAKRRRPFRPHLPIGRFPGVVNRFVEESGETLYAQFFNGLRNPSLTLRQRALIEADLDDMIPAFENSIETEHFVLRWTNQSSHVDDNIADQAIVEETGEHLEGAWERYVTVFGRSPHLPPGSSKMEVNFYDGPWWGVASPPDGPIGLNSKTWVDMPGVRQSVSAHELFHKLQYAFGYRTKHTPRGNYKWFSEGTASWSEVFMWRRVSRQSKITDMFLNPDINLYQASYSALPYWIFFQTRQQDTPDDNPLVGFLDAYDAKEAKSPGDPGWEEGYPERQVMRELIEADWPPNNVYGQLAHFFALFSRERRIGAWRQTPTGGQPYSEILNPNDENIVPELSITDIPLELGDNYQRNASVSQLGSDYYRFNFLKGTGQETFSVSVEGVPDGDYSYYLIWEKDGAWNRAAFPSGVTSDYGFAEEIDLDVADSLILIVSGRGKGGAYTIDASVS